MEPCRIKVKAAHDFFECKIDRLIAEVTACFRGECAAGYTAAEIRHSLCCPPHERGQEPFAAVGRCTVMYGMYGKNGSGGIPSKYRTLSDIPYTDKVIFRAVRRREMTA